MRKSWPYLVAVAILGALAGTAIAGWPGGADDVIVGSATGSTDVVADSGATTTSLGNIVPATPAPVATTVAPATTAAPVTTVAVTAAPATTVRPTTTVAAATSAAVTTVAATSSTSTPPTTVASTTTSPATTTSTTRPPSTSTIVPADVTLERADVRLVLANGDGRFNLVGRNRDRLLALGYVSIDQTDVSDRPPATIIYFRPGFDDEAEILADDLQTPNADIVELPDEPVTINDDLGDLIVVLGPDAIR